MDGGEGLEKIGDRLRDSAAGDPRAGDEIRRARGVFLEEVARRNAAGTLRRTATRRYPRWLPLVVSASVVVGSVGLWLRTRSVAFQVGEAHPGRVGDVIEAAPGGGVTPVSFSEGSTLMVQEGGRIRVLSIEKGGARVLVEDGVVDASITPRRSEKARWRFEVGPYQVTVKGTKFRMAFRASERSLRVATQEGRVSVSGGCLDAPRAVGAGESLDASCPPREAPAPDGPPPQLAPVVAPPLAAPSPVTRAKVTRPDRWRELLAAGQLQEGLRAAEQANFGQVCQLATAKELLALSDAGRFFGRSRRAVAALGALRRRFPGSSEAGTAAFTLGRIVFEKEHAYAQAANWFETYLKEQPSGPLMGDAFGRLMEARLKSGDGAGARTSAEQYLRRFPEGPYSSEARGILSR